MPASRATSVDLSDRLRRAMSTGRHDAVWECVPEFGR
ncbi:hypothetical protein FHW15_000955 [Terracoccus luteus]|uniref:Uncharacterized protein n=1 Tax=Terracoccus luteus TaxID=53356 RepID=A0A839PZK2_9MICO|nr:hypothetical protein [Terracoccus luteus]MCP2171463.1 hypothetical protein [Terracoccus luteus]